MTPRELITKWRADADVLAIYDQRLAEVARRHAEQLEAAVRAEGDDVLDLTAAAKVSGYSVDRLRHKIARAHVGERKCPDCAEWIKIEARECRFCGADVSQLNVERGPRADWSCKRCYSAFSSDLGVCPNCGSGEAVRVAPTLPIEETRFSKMVGPGLLIAVALLAILIFAIARSPSDTATSTSSSSTDGRLQADLQAAARATDSSARSDSVAMLARVIFASNMNEKFKYQNVSFTTDGAEATMLRLSWPDADSIFAVQIVGTLDIRASSRRLGFRRIEVVGRDYRRTFRVE